MKFKLPKDVECILETLKKNGHQGYVVGGCVRDLLLGKVPKDWDVATSASVKEIQSTFKKTIDVGVSHGTIIVVINGINYEVTTLKSDSGDLFDSDIKNDLAKRDLTINAIAYTLDGFLIDPFGGEKDLQAKVIRAVLNPKQRFLEDPLRMLRAIRLSAKLEFVIDDDTFCEIAQNAQKILNVSVERIRQELTKILLIDARKLEDLYKTNLLKHVLPEFNDCFNVSQNHTCHLYDVARHTILVVEGVEKSEDLVWAALLHDIGKPLTKTVGKDGFDHFKGHVEKGYEISREVLKHYRFDNKLIETVLILIKNHDKKINIDKRSLRNLLSTIGKTNLKKLLKLKVADDSAKSKGVERFSIENEKEILNLIGEIEQNEECFSLKQMAIDGDDLKKIGLTEGKMLGDTLKKLLEMVVKDPSLNTREKLLDIASRISNKRCQR